jgi:hypothetical protein
LSAAGLSHGYFCDPALDRQMRRSELFGLADQSWVTSSR